MGRRMKVYRPPWTRGMVSVLLLRAWGVTTNQALFTDSGRRELGVVGWALISAFIVKNSWGAGWGEAGYFRIDYSELTGTTNFASWTYAYGNVYQAIVEFVPPETAITSGPSGTITTSSATFTFTFTGSDNVTPVASLVYATYLQGYDNGWSGFSSSTAKSYNNLPPVPMV